ncbi:MAG: hypothetical protein LBR06_05490 [Bacteroidales bacterium]|jgi:hypothetical protein|nr:hypothetical protein [Bacteroidales bacterium]
MKKRLTVLFLGASLCGHAQEWKPDMKFYGFVRTELFADTYKGMDAVHDAYYLFPLYAGQDAEGKDINEQPAMTLTALATRMGVNISGPDLFGAKTSANIECDFGGVTRIYPAIIRIRHANVVFRWEQSKLLVGQYWHPFSGGSYMPTVAGLNTGAPFQTFSRAPQVRFDWYKGAFSVMLAAASETQFTSKALETASYDRTSNHAIRNGLLPEMVLALTYAKDALEFGAGGQTKRIKPRMTTTGTAGTYVAEEFLTTFAGNAYLSYKTSKFSLLAKGYFGQDLSHLSIIGGYGVATRNGNTGAETYTPYTSWASYINLVYGTKLQGSLLAGYSGNLGTKDALYDSGAGPVTAGLTPNVNNVSRISGYLIYNFSKIKFIGGYELTSANYGVGTFDWNDGLYADSHAAVNHRLIFTMMYSF